MSNVNAINDFRFRSNVFAITIFGLQIDYVFGDVESYLPFLSSLGSDLPWVGPSYFRTRSISHMLLKPYYKHMFHFHRGSERKLFRILIYTHSDISLPQEKFRLGVANAAVTHVDSVVINFLDEEKTVRRVSRKLLATAVVIDLSIRVKDKDAADVLVSSLVSSVARRNFKDKLNAELAKQVCVRVLVKYMCNYHIHLYLYLYSNRVYYQSRHTHTTTNK